MAASTKHPVLPLLLLAGLCIALAIMALLWLSDIPLPVAGRDHWLHILAFLCASLLCFGILERLHLGKLRLLVIVLTVIGLCLLAALTEYVQFHYQSNHEMSELDWVMDLVGITIAGGIYSGLWCIAARSGHG